MVAGVLLASSGFAPGRPAAELGGYRGTLLRHNRRGTASRGPVLPWRRAAASAPTSSGWFAPVPGRRTAQPAIQQRAKIHRKAARRRLMSNSATRHSES